MATAKATFDEALKSLQDERSKVRRRGAQRLAELSDAKAARALRDRLEIELMDPRTWETQYELARALGFCGSGKDDRDWLKEIAKGPREQVMVNVAIGEAVVRLSKDDEDAAIEWCLTTPVDLLAEGCERAVALMRLRPSEATRSLLMADADRRLSDPEHPKDTLGIWVVVAAAGWDDTEARAFLKKYRGDSRDDVAQAAESSLSGKFMELQQY